MQTSINLIIDTVLTTLNKIKIILVNCMQIVYNYFFGVKYLVIYEPINMK